MLWEVVDIYYKWKGSEYTPLGDPGQDREEIWVSIIDADTLTTISQVGFEPS